MGHCPSNTKLYMLVQASGGTLWSTFTQYFASGANAQSGRDWLGRLYSGCCQFDVKNNLHILCA